MELQVSSLVWKNIGDLYYESLHGPDKPLVTTARTFLKRGSIIVDYVIVIYITRVMILDDS